MAKIDGGAAAAPSGRGRRAGGGTSAGPAAYFEVVPSLALEIDGSSVTAPGPRGGARAAAGATRIVDGFRDEHVALWLATPAGMPVIGRPAGFFAKLANARAARRLLDAIAAEAERLPESGTDGRAWRERARARVEGFGRQRLGWSESFGRLLLADDFFVSSARFIRQARAFWPALSLDQLGQALRNVWIGNWLQLLRGRRVEMRPGLFAYSMLYPLTDNLLDDESVPVADKRAFGLRFGARLAGDRVLPHDEREAAVFELVRRIEQELPRSEFPNVHARLLAIHGAQSRSLRQHHGEALSDAELLSLSVGKGGCSVLADLHLVTGRPSPSEERFAFGYGVFLQLLDDLQDVEQDLAAGHETLFARAARQGTLDVPTARLARFVDRVLDGHGLISGPEFDERKDLVRRNCRALLVGSVAEHGARFSRRFRRELAARWPLSLRACRRLRRRAARRWGRITARLEPEALSALLDSAGADAIVPRESSPYARASSVASTTPRTRSTL